jgi:hypothetical protein
MHIVTTNIRPDGSRISNDLRSHHRLMELCLHISIRQNLTVARHNRYRWKPSLAGEQPVYPQRLKYGEIATKTGIEQVLDHTINKFTYTSLDHLNALLGLYNVRADRGSMQGAMFRNEGLYYRIIDAEGKKMGAPIKASVFPGRPTLKKLQENFRNNIQKEQQAIRNVDDALVLSLFNDPPPSLDYFRKKLWEKNIALVIPALTQRPTRKQAQAPASGPALAPLPDDGHGFFYIDHRNLVILRDTQLGDRYTAAAILQRYKLDQTILSLVAQGQLHVNRSTQRLLNSSDAIQQRNALLRLTPQHDQWEAQQEEQREAHRQAHRMRISF